MNKILDLIFEDVKNENETKKTAVTLRISALIFIGYFLCLMAVFCSMGDWMNVGGCLVCGVCYVLSFYTTYWNHTRESAWISQILIICAPRSHTRCSTSWRSCLPYPLF